MKIQSVQKTNSYKQSPKVCFGMHLGEIKGLEEIFPDMSNHQITQFNRNLDTELQGISLTKSVDYLLTPVDNHFVECTINAGHYGIITQRLSEITVGNLVALANKVRG